MARLPPALAQRTGEARLEPYEGKLSRTVLRGARAANSPRLLGNPHGYWGSRGPERLQNLHTVTNRKGRSGYISGYMRQQGKEEGKQKEEVRRAESGRRIPFLHSAFSFYLLPFPALGWYE